MENLVNLKLKNDLKKFGVQDWEECYHCGQCTANCPLTEQHNLFPRKSIRSMQLGLKKTLTGSLEPWLCYYCGDCSKDCPRNANPGEMMMALRRFLTSIYDWTGISKLVYTSKLAEFALIFLFALLVLVLSIIYSQVPDQSLWLTSEGGVALNHFYPVAYVHIGDMIMFIILAGLLITNILNMYFKVIVSQGVRVPFFSYFKELWVLIWNFVTQKKFSKCDSRPYWFIHLFLVTGYVALFVMVVVFLKWFQTDDIHAWYHPQRLLGYYATVGLFLGTIYFTYRRFKKKKENSKYSHYTDWTFIVMLFLTTLTGILVHIFRINGWALATYYTYVVHLMVLTPMLMIEVPFSKWSHLAYRPFAVYFARLKQAALKKEQKINTYELQESLV